MVVEVTEYKVECLDKMSIYNDSNQGVKWQEMYVIFQLNVLVIAIEYWERLYMQGTFFTFFESPLSYKMLSEHNFKPSAKDPCYNRLITVPLGSFVGAMRGTEQHKFVAQWSRHVFCCAAHNEGVSWGTLWQRVWQTCSLLI